MVNAYLADREGLLGDPDLSQEGKMRKVQALKQTAYASCLSDAGGIFGERGAFWAALQAAQERMTRARSEAEQTVISDPVRVQLAGQRLAHILGQPGMDLAGARRWFKGEASQNEKIALALADESTVATALRLDLPAVRSLLAEARAWLDGALDTAEVQAARRLLEQLDAAGVEAAKAIEQAAATFGDRLQDGFWYPTGEGDLAGLLATVNREGPGQWTRRP